MHDKEALQVVYEDLVEQHNTLKEEHVRLPFLWFTSQALRSD